MFLYINLWLFVFHRNLYHLTSQLPQPLQTQLQLQVALWWMALQELLVSGWKKSNQNLPTRMRMTSVQRQILSWRVHVIQLQRKESLFGKMISDIKLLLKTILAFEATELPGLDWYMSKLKDRCTKERWKEGKKKQNSKNMVYKGMLSFVLRWIMVIRSQYT